MGMTLTREQIDDMRTSLGRGAQPFTKEAIESLCLLALSALSETAATPPDRSDAVNLARNVRERDRPLTPAGRNLLVDAVLQMDEWIKTSAASAPSASVASVSASEVKDALDEAATRLGAYATAAPAEGQTPRTDALTNRHKRELPPDEYFNHGVALLQIEELLEHARQLERELAAANERGENLHAKLRELDAARSATGDIARDAERYRWMASHREETKALLANDFKTGEVLVAEIDEAVERWKS